MGGLRDSRAENQKVKREGKSMNVSVINKSNVKDGALDDLAKELPIIISKVLEVPGGRMAILKPEQVSLDFCQASVRDVGSDIRIKVLARCNEPRTEAEYDLVKEILEKVVAVIKKSGEEYSVDVRLYLMEIAAADYSPGN
jgi:hypothetical protein